MDEQERQQLNRDIAQALGWKLHFYTAETHLNSQWQLENPDGKVVTGYRSSYGQTEETEWNELLPIYIPDYAADLNAGMDVLPERMHIIIEPIRKGSTVVGYDAAFIDPDAETTSIKSGSGATRKEAFARALLSWALATKARAT